MKSGENRTLEMVSRCTYSMVGYLFVALCFIFSVFDQVYGLQTVSYQSDNLNPQSELSHTNSDPSFHLISLPPLHTSSGSRQISSMDLGLVGPISPKIIRDIWKWKDKSLGDGRDFFVPRPRAIKALCEQLMRNYTSYIPDNFSLCNHTIQEIAILSNCARMDILIVASSDDQTSDELLSLDDTLLVRVASCLSSQVESYKDKNMGSVWDTLGIGSTLDLPGMIDESPTVSDESTVEIVARGLVHIKGVDEIAMHLCKVALGVADRPSRPDREVLFRPFSSRDAHIMLQLKRTKEVSIGSKVKLIIDASLQAGKRGRDTSVVPELLDLRKYGDSSHYPKDLSERASQAVMIQVVNPIIKNLKSKFVAMKSSEKINFLLASVEKFAKNNNMNDQQRKRLKSLVHRPIVSLRKGESFDEFRFWKELDDMLIET